ncbi:hypothetical protein MMC20_002399 [Loxospora ochrophaea]|nr:hypothetical protein [Loxospora ochrophaea]
MSTTDSGGLRALCGSLAAILAVVGGLRFYARRVQRADLGADDWMTIPSYMAFIGMVACALLGIHIRIFGYSDDQVAAAKIPFSIEASLVVSLDVLSAASLGFTRISALLFYRRIFCVAGHASTLRAAIYTGIVIISLWMAAFIILPPLQCGPNLSVWSASAKVRAAYCGMGNKIILGFCISDFLIETAVILMPIPKILQLKTSLKRRLAVLFVFLTAFVSLGAVVARLVITVKLLDHQIEDLSKANTTQTFMWILEAGFALITVNLPSLWGLRHKVQPASLLGSLRSAILLRSTRSDGSGTRSRTFQNDQAGQTDRKRAGDPYNVSFTGNSSWERLPNRSHIEMAPRSGASNRSWASSERNVENSMHVASLPKDTV